MIVDYRCCFSDLSVSFPWNITAESVDYRCNEPAQTASPIRADGQCLYSFIAVRTRTNGSGLSVNTFTPIGHYLDLLGGLHPSAHSLIRVEKNPQPCIIVILRPSECVLRSIA